MIASPPRVHARVHLCLAVLLARGTAHTACFRMPGCTRSSFLCGKPCVNTGAISTAAWKICAAEVCFPKVKGAAAALSLFVSPEAVRLAHGPYPRHCLAVLSPDTGQTAGLRLSRRTPSSFLGCRHSCVGHDLTERSPVECCFTVGRNAAAALRLYVFVSPAAV